MAVVIFPASNVQAADQPGETLLKQHCAACQSRRKQYYQPLRKLLQKKSREANKVKTADDIVKTMRSPGHRHD